MTKTDEKVEIKGIRVKIGKDNHSLTMDQAKKLHQALNELFDEKVVVKEVIVKEIHHHEHDRYRWYHHQQMWDTVKTPLWRPGEITCAVDSPSEDVTNNYLYAEIK